MTIVFGGDGSWFAAEVRWSPEPACSQDHLGRPKSLPRATHDQLIRSAQEPPRGTQGPPRTPQEAPRRQPPDKHQQKPWKNLCLL